MWQMANDKQCSEFMKLDGDAKKRYMSKASLLDDMDPYTLKHVGDPITFNEIIKLNSH